MNDEAHEPSHSSPSSLRLRRFLPWLWNRISSLGRGWGFLSSWDPHWTKKQKGAWGERAAERFLQRQGHRILNRNVSYKSGELDLVTDDRGTLVFVEVKTRTEPARNPPLLAVDGEKLDRLRSAGRLYLRRIRPPLPPTRIDLIGVVPDETTRHPRIRYEKGVVWLVPPPQRPSGSHGRDNPPS